MRGKGNCEIKFSALRGITPAHAGKREDNILLLTADKDHPRTCGEKVIENGSDN